MTQRFLPVLLLTSALMGGMVGAFFVSTAHAQSAPPRMSQCKVMMSRSNEQYVADIQAWLNEQLAAGRTNVLVTEATFCAW